MKYLDGYEPEELLYFVSIVFPAINNFLLAYTESEQFLEIIPEHKYNDHYFD